MITLNIIEILKWYSIIMLIAMLIFSIIMELKCKDKSIPAIIIENIVIIPIIIYLILS